MKTMENNLSLEAENKLFEYYVEKSKRPHDWYWREADMISGSADYLPSDSGGDPAGYRE